MAEHTDKEQKTEEATPRRRREARQEGQVAYSSEVVASLMLATGAGALLLAGGSLANGLGGLVIGALEGLAWLGREPLDPRAAAATLRAAVGEVIGPVLFVIVPSLAVGLLVAFGQVGFVLAPKAVAADPSKLDPVKGAKRLVSPRSIVRTLLALVKITAITGVVAAVAWVHLDEVARLAGSDLGPTLVGLGRVAVRCAAAALIVVIAISLVDLLFQRRQHDRDLRMSKQEVKEEARTTEGDPLVKGRIRRLQREAAQRRMMADVPDATVVVTNPTHVAIALRYRRGPDGVPLDGAPRCVAKGVDHLARRIREVAREAGVPLYEDVPLARALHDRVEIGDEIPEELYGAVAAVLRYVYRVQGVTVGA